MSALDTADNENERRVIAEFFDELRDAAASLQVLLGNLRSKAVPEAEGIAEIRRSAHNMGTQAQAIGVPLIKLITHRLSEYVADLKQIGPAEIDGIETFIGKIEATANGEPVAEADIPSVMRSLPAKRSVEADFGKIEKNDVEILLVLPERAMAHIVERELANCGYRTSLVRDPFQAIETVVRTRPDMVVGAMELGTGLISGVDLACALAAMPATEAIPYALLTSYELGHAKLKGLPARAAIVRKGAMFGVDIAETVIRFGVGA